MTADAQHPLLSTLLRHAQSRLGHWIADSSAAREELAGLEGRLLRIEIERTDLCITIGVDDQRVRLTAGKESGEADIVIRAGLFELMELQRAQSMAQLRAGEIEFRGSLRVAEQFSRMLKLARPQLEDELAGWIGGVPAHLVVQTGQSVAQWCVRTRRALELDVTEYLQSETRALPLPDEVADFLNAVEYLRDDVARLEQRIERLIAAENR